MIALNTYIKYIISLLGLLFCLLINQDISAQSTSPKKQAKQVDQTVKQTLVKDEAKSEEVTYDTGETINYLGSRMAYQLKKRLHLTDETDEKAEQKAKKKAAKGKFSIFGIEIEKH